ncbi:MAG: citrate synthase [archaeon]|jgi:citrate synthase
MVLEDNFIQKIKVLALQSDKPSPQLIKEKNIALGLRYENGSGVVVGITSKGQVLGYAKKEEKLVAIEGKLFYCGYDVEELVKNIENEYRFGFEEIVYLLFTGYLPKEKDLKEFKKILGGKRKLSPILKKRLPYNSKNKDVMGALHTIVSAMHLVNEKPNSTDIEEIILQCIDLIAKFPTIIAYSYIVLKNGGKSKLLSPKKSLSTSENFLYMLSGKIPDKETAKIFDLALILHAEHGGGNNSTFSTRCVSSSGANTYMSICAGIGSLSGYLHGGANEAVIDMMTNIKKNVKNWEDKTEIENYLKLILEGKANDKTGKIYGMGHAVYTLSDPRVKIFEAKAKILAKSKNKEKEFELYKLIAAIAPDLVYKKKGKIVCINVDFYSGFVYEMIGIPKELFTPIFAMARVAGWSAHRIEEIIQGKLMRPAYATTIKDTKKYIPLKKRK